VANLKAPGGRKYNPGWHLALDLRNMLVVSECTARAALEREESRGGHTREDFPAMDPKWRKLNLVCSLADDEVVLTEQPVPTMRDDLLNLFDRSELSKYMTEEELSAIGKADN
jgi:succinate dehydrogenase / fumarate reductase flavoprotein subunit